MTPADKTRFIDQHYHDLFGIVADAYVVNRSGPELSRAMQLAATRVRAKLAEVFDQFVPPPQQPIQPPKPAGTPPAGPGPAQPRR